MPKLIAYAPNGQAYQCDTAAEVKQVQGAGKSRNPGPYRATNEGMAKGYWKVVGPEGVVSSGMTSKKAALAFAKECTRRGWGVQTAAGGTRRNPCLPCMLNPRPKR